MRYEPLTATDPPAFPGFTGLLRELRRWRRHAALTAMALVAGLAFAFAVAGLAAHNHHIERQRAAVTQAFFRLYGQPPVSDSWMRLSETWKAYEPELEPLLERINEADGAELAERALEWDYAVNRIIEEEGLVRDIEVVFGFFRAVGRCVGVAHCDRAMTAAYFGHDPWAFRNMHYPFLKDVYPTEDFDAYFEHVAPRRPAA